jgi:hypothetical protein
MSPAETNWMMYMTRQGTTGNGPALREPLSIEGEVTNYKIEIYTNDSKSEKGVGSGIAVFVDGSLTFQLRYKLVDKCTNNQVEQLAIAKALE